MGWAINGSKTHWSIGKLRNKGTTSLFPRIPTTTEHFCAMIVLIREKDENESNSRHDLIKKGASQLEVAFPPLARSFSFVFLDIPQIPLLLL